MATMSATMKQFTKGLQAALEPMSTSMANIEQALVVTASREDIVEDKRNEKKKLDEETKQTSLLERLFGKQDKKDKKEGGFFSKHWGKILTAMAGLLLFLPKDFLKEKLFNVKWWKDTAWVLGGALVTYLATKAAWSASAGVFGGAIAGAVTSSLLTGAALPAALTGAFKMTGVLAVALAMGQLAIDAWDGYHANWDSSKFSNTFGAALGGTGKGWINSLKQSMKWGSLFALAGYKAGGLPGAVAGLLLGAALGGIAGYIGGEAIAKGIDGIGEKISEFWTNLKNDYWIPGTAEYDAKAREFGGKLSKSIDKFIGDMWDKTFDTITSAWKWSKSFVNDIITGTKNMMNNPANIPPDSHAGQALAKARKEMNDKEYLEYLKRMQGKQGYEHDPLFWFQNQSFRGDGSGQKFSVRNTAFGTQADRNWINKVDPGLLLEYIRQGGSLQSWGIKRNTNFKMTTGRASSWTHLGENTKAKTNMLAVIWDLLGLGEMRMTSGWRNDKTQIAAMINRKTPLGGGKFVNDKLVPGNFKVKTGAYAVAQEMFHKKLLSKEEGAALAGTDLRKKAVEKMVEYLKERGEMFRLGGVHGHGRGIDVAYPEHYSKKNFNALKAKLQSHFPGAKIDPEGDHVHIGFNPNTSPEFVRQSMIDLQKNNLDLQEARAGGGGNNNAFVTTDNSTRNQSTQQFLIGDGAVNPDVARPRLSGYDRESGNTFS